MMELGPYELGPGGENEGIYTGDARLLSAAIPDESVDLIFADPVYQNIDDYRWLAETAARVLKPDRACLVFCGTKYLAQVISTMQLSLNYRWCFALSFIGGGATYWHGKIGVKWVPVLWFDKGHCIPLRGIPDAGAFPRGMRANSKWQSNVHTQWSKSNELYEWRVRAFTLPNAIVFDPFTGGGTVPAVCKMLSRQYLAFEIEPDVAELARDRVRQTQPPLPGLTLETQAALELGEQ